MATGLLRLVNDSGVAVGYRSGVPPFGRRTVATVTSRRLSTLPNQQFGFAEDINNAGIVVGHNAAPVTLS
jgi:hypothetical protein